MPSLADHHASRFVKLLFLGDAKSGKTTAIGSLVRAGYTVRILDFDNLLETLVKRIQHECPDRLGSVEARTMRDIPKATDSGMKFSSTPKAWIDSLKMLNVWKYTDAITGEVIDFGKPSEWGENVILVIDSLTRWSDAALDYHEAVGGALDGRMQYYNAQLDVERQIAGLTSSGFATNVIVICHGVLQDRPDGTKKMFPKSVGSALNPLIPTYFPNFIQLAKTGEKRTIKLISSPMIDLATTDHAALPKELDADDGLAKFFAALKGQHAKKADPEPSAPTALPRPATLTLKRV